jgi:hypothetical protein
VTLFQLEEVNAEVSPAAAQRGSALPTATGLALTLHPSWTGAPTTHAGVTCELVTSPLP